MSRWRQVWLVARREIVERGRSRGFLFSLALTTLLVIGAFLLPVFLFASQDERKLGIAAPAPPGLRESILAVSPTYGLTVILSDHIDRAAAEAALESEAIEAFVAVPEDLSGPGEIVVRDRPDDRLRALVIASVVSLRTNELLAEAGVSAGDLAEAARAPALTEIEPHDAADETAFLFANIGVVLLFMGIFGFGTWVLTGVVEEKQSRVVEVVLSSVRPRDVLMGKVLGIGLLGVVQLVIFVTAGVAVAQLSGRLTLPATTVPAMVQLVVWFCLGYAFYATMMGFLGSLASRTEEASNASTPVTLLATTSYLVSLLVVTDDPDGLIAVIASLIPFSAPMVVPLRAALDAITPLETAAAIAVMVVSVALLFVLGGRVYSGAVLQTAGRMKLRDAWRSADTR